MTDLLELSPFGARDDQTLLSELSKLTLYHSQHCQFYSQIIGEPRDYVDYGDLPFVHVGVFKNLALESAADSAKNGLYAISSATSTGTPSKVRIDSVSSSMQARSITSILSSVLGPNKKPLLIVDNPKELRSRDAFPARLAAGISLKNLSSDVYFLLDRAGDPSSFKVDLFRSIIQCQQSVLVYGLTWILWRVFGDSCGVGKATVRDTSCKIDFVHSGGWKRFEQIATGNADLDAAIGQGAHRVFNLFGLTEQMGIFFPLCAAGMFHVPVWANVIVRDLFSLNVVEGESGLLQFMSPLNWGSPAHSVLTDDVGVVRRGKCDCGWRGVYFRLDGRVPRSEARGCGNI